ncbi:MAG: PQQ-dependent sugar dehydrogenase, partial [Verrucomicrobiota bacterium]
LAFGPDGYLYLSVGDGSLWDNRVTQRLDAGFFGGILRIDVDRRPGNPAPNPGFGVNPDAYSVPADNPFVAIREYRVGDRVVGNGADPASLRTEFYALGLRNPWQFSFDPKTGELWCNDVGYGSREEVNRIRAGANYGWPWWEGTLEATDPEVAGTVLPEFEYSHFSGRTAITGSRFYRGSLYPGLDGCYLFADWSGDIAILRPGEPGEPEVTWIANLPGVVALGTDPRDGSVLLTSGSGRIHRLVHRPVTGDPWPEHLSETGLFEDLLDRTPRPGLVPYEINAPFWSDHALKQRWFAIPGQKTIDFSRDGAWTFPTGTVWVKHFDRPYYRPDRMLFPMETRILVQTPQGMSGATYRWNDDGTDADLVPAEGANAQFYAWTPTNLVTQNWRFPGRNECLSCHTKAIGGPAGFRTAQLNRRVLRGLEALSQLDEWSDAGYFSKPLVRTHQMPALVAPMDETQGLKRRVRAYLDANCAACHQPGGLTRTPWDARIGTALDQMGLIGTRPSVPVPGFGGFLIDPGHPENSVLFQRVASLGTFHMPPLGTSELDAAAVELLRRWIVEALPNRSGYDAWATQWLPEPWGGLRSQSLDPDGDGLDNFTEFLLGEGPLNPVRRWKPVISRDGSRAVLRFDRWAGRRFEVEWASDPRGTSHWSRLEVEENDPRARAFDSPATIPLPDGPTRFYRVTVAGE